MQTQTTEVGAAPRTMPGLGLDDLAAMSVEELTARYGRGTVPDSLRLLDGRPICRMLAVRGLPVTTTARLAASQRFPWAGKTFRAESDGRGEGINRVRLFGTHEWYPFSTSIASSVMDGKPCILLDYDRKENPFFIRAIRDELREVSPGLFLGPALIDTKRGTPTLALFFACDTRASAGHR